MVWSNKLYMVAGSGLFLGMEKAMTLRQRIQYVLKRPIFYKNGLLYVPTEFDILVDLAYRDCKQKNKK